MRYSAGSLDQPDSMVVAEDMGSAALFYRLWVAGKPTRRTESMPLRGTLTHLRKTRRWGTRRICRAPAQPRTAVPHGPWSCDIYVVDFISGVGQPKKSM